MSQPANFWRHEKTFVADPFILTSFSGPPQPPTNLEVEPKVQLALDQAIGEFVRKIVDAGYTVTVKDYGYGYHFEYVEGGVSGYTTRVYWAKYQFHLTIYVEYITNAPAPLNTLLAPVLVFLIAMALVLVLAMVAYEFAHNLTSKTEINEQYGWVQNPNTGIWEWVVISRKTTTGPPDWWAYIIPIIALGGIVLLCPSLITGLRGAFAKREKEMVTKTRYEKGKRVIYHEYE